MILVRVFFSLLIVGPLVLGVINFVQNRTIELPGKTKNYTVLINSAILYAIAYNVIFFIQELFLVLGKNSLGLTAYLYHNNHSWDGVHAMTALMQGLGALAIFVTGLLCLGWFFLIRSSTSLWKVLLLWLAFQGLIQSIPQVVIGYFDPNTDVGQALVGYLNITENLLVALSVVSIVATALVSIGFSRLLLETAPTFVELDNAKMRLAYIRFIAVGAGLLGCVLLIPFRILPVSQIVGPFILFAFSVPWIWSIAGILAPTNSYPNDINDKIRWEPVLLLVLLLIVFRAVLAPGVTFTA